MSKKDHNMTKNRDLTAFVFGLCPLIPVCSNLAYGMVLAGCVWIVFFGGLVSKGLSKWKYLNALEKPFVRIFTVFVTVFLNFLLQGLFPVIQGALQTYIYILGVSYIIFLSIADYSSSAESLDLPVTYTVLIICFALIREIAAFGSISFPVPSGFLTVEIPYLAENPPFRFLGTSAGALILLGVCLWALLFAGHGRLSAFKRREQ